MNSPVYIDKEQCRTDFECEESELNDFIKKYARQNHTNNISKTYVVLDNNKVVAYYTLVYENIELKDISNEIPSDLMQNRKDKIPCVLLGMLARDKKLKGQDYGMYLLYEAIKKTYEASQIAGIKGLFLTPINERVAKKFYDKIEFLQKIDERLYYIPIATIRALVKETEIG